ncbi:HNH endonuclease [Flavobacterium sp.]|uniref:HNH endonuclease n=1 Tax=Flavobacterium sp. TaxID=239 RepID=UPI0035B00072
MRRITKKVKFKLKNLFILLFFISFCGFSQNRHITTTTKKIVFARDGGVCQCCGSADNIEYDHIMPFSCGGKSEASNVQLLCRKCNRSKSNSCECKVHHKKVGINCCDEKTVKKRDAKSQQCTGTTKKGTRCKNRTTNSNGRCHLH